MTNHSPDAAVATSDQVGRLGVGLFLFTFFCFVASTAIIHDSLAPKIDALKPPHAITIWHGKAIVDHETRLILEDCVSGRLTIVEEGK